MMARLRPRNWRRPVTVVLIVLVLGGGLGWAVKELLEPEEAESKIGLGPPSRMTIKDGVVTLTITETERQNSGIETARPAPPPKRGSIIGYGTVLDAAPLSELSNQYREAEAQVESAEARLAVSLAAFERARILNKDQQNISTAQLQAAEGGFAVDKAALAAARTRVAAVTATVEQGWGRVIGAALFNHEPLLTRLTERRDYLVKVTLPPGAAVATPPEIATAMRPGDNESSLAFVSRATAADPRLQGTGFFYRATAESGLLPGFNLSVVLPITADETGVVVPEAAVVWLQGAAWIYLRADATTFIRREVTPRHATAAGFYVVADIGPDSEVVVRGAQMLLSEEFRAQVPVED